MIMVIEHFSSRELTSARNFCDFILPETNYNIFRFKVGVDYFAHAMQVVQPNQTLPSKLAR